MYRDHLLSLPKSERIIEVIDPSSTTTPNTKRNHYRFYSTTPNGDCGFEAIALAFNILSMAAQQQIALNTNNHSNNSPSSTVPKYIWSEIPALKELEAKKMKPIRNPSIVVRSWFKVIRKKQQQQQPKPPHPDSSSYPSSDNNNGIYKSTLRNSPSSLDVTLSSCSLPSTFPLRISPHQVRKLLRSELLRNRTTYEHLAFKFGLITSYVDVSHKHSPCTPSPELDRLCDLVKRSGTKGHWLGQEWGPIELMAIANALKMNINLFTYDPDLHRVRKYDSIQCIPRHHHHVKEFNDDADTTVPQVSIGMLYSGNSKKGHFDLMLPIATA